MSWEQLEGVDLEFGVCSGLGQQFHFLRIQPTQPHSTASTFPFLPSPAPVSHPNPSLWGSPGQI